MMRDFLYNKSDVLLAIAIIVVAAAVILSRLGVIMERSSGEKADSPRDFIALVLPWIDGADGAADAGENAGAADAGENAGVGAGSGGTEADAQADGAGTQAGADGQQGAGGGQAAGEAGGGGAQGDGADAGAQAQGDGMQAPQGADTPQPTQPAQTGAPQVVHFQVKAGDVASTIADNLAGAQLISDKQSFLNAVDAAKAATRLKIGDFDIPMGSTPEQIVAILVG